MRFSVILNKSENACDVLVISYGDMGVWAPDPSCNMYGDQYNEMNCLQQKEAKHCVVTMRRTEYGSGNRCCYDKIGNLMYTNDTSSGSTPGNKYFPFSLFLKTLLSFIFKKIDTIHLAWHRIMYGVKYQHFHIIFMILFRIIYAVNGVIFVILIYMQDKLKMQKVTENQEWVSFEKLYFSIKNNIFFSKI